MRRRLGYGTLLLTLTVAAAAILAPAAAATPVLPAAAAASAPPALKLIEGDGFGDARNVYSWSMARFRGKIYVGTGRSVACVENVTIDFFLRVSGRYVTNPLPGATCPPDPYDLDLRAEIWEYNLRTGRWRLAYRSPADTPNPRAPGKFVARDIAFRGMTVFRDGRGRKRLYVGGVTADEYIPELKLEHPPRFLSTRDGRHWRATPVRRVVVRVPYGTFRPIGIRSMRIWRGKLFATLTPGLTGDGPIFEVTRPWSPRGARFRQVTPKSISVFETETFNGSLYAGTGDRERGYAVYRIVRDGSRYRIWPVVTDGAGRGQIATSVVSMHVFKGRLYVGSSGWYNREENPISEIIRIDRRGDWQVVAGPTRVVDRVVKAPISGMGDGFNNMFTAHFWRMATYRGALVVGTNDWSYLLPVAFPALDQWVIELLELVIKYEGGFDLWGTCNGRDWGPITRDGFGGHKDDFGARNFIASGSGLFVGTANHVTGTKIWRYPGVGCPKTAAVAAGAPAAPRRLLTDVQRAGTVLSWAAARSDPPGTRYRVLRASYEQVPVTLAAPPVERNGFPLEGQLPVIVPPGTAGGTAVDVPVMLDFNTVGMTSAPYFVDRTARRGDRYAYRVVAETTSGTRSAPSNMQVVPDPRPVPTLEQVRRGIGPTAFDRRATMATLARSHGARAAVRRSLARLRRETRPGSDIRLLIERLERRVRYTGIADGLRG